MALKFLSIVTTPKVAAAQRDYYGRAQALPEPPATDPLGEDEQRFINARDSFYLATVSESGWPYLQHRGGPAGFLHVLSPHQLGFADYRGNRQMLSTGNLATNDKVALFLMDYPRRERLKILGHARVLDARSHPELKAQLAPPALAGKVERLFLIDVVGFDWNCSQHITPRYTASEVEALVAPLRAQIRELTSGAPPAA
ncbi:MAG TPA: pyridoxamine 5'-phosphate oxidase family protein [Opitutaceae bacterium]